MACSRVLDPGLGAKREGEGHEPGNNRVFPDHAQRVVLPHDVHLRNCLAAARDCLEAAGGRGYRIGRFRLAGARGGNQVCTNSTGQNFTKARDM
eukprot:5383229-Pyramimonas_sp.AAC.1